MPWGNTTVWNGIRPELVTKSAVLTTTASPRAITHARER